jgi:hypothetical protein
METLHRDMPAIGANISGFIDITAAPSRTVGASAQTRPPNPQ